MNGHNLRGRGLYLTLRTQESTRAADASERRYGQCARIEEHVFRLACVRCVVLVYVACVASDENQALGLLIFPKFHLRLRLVVDLLHNLILPLHDEANMKQT